MKNILWLMGLIVLMLVAAGTYTYLKPAPANEAVAPATQTVSIYLARSGETDIELVAVEREVVFSDVAEELMRSALSVLVQGPSADEVEAGLSSPFNEGTVVNSVVMNEGVVTADFNEQFDFQMGGSARVMAMRQSVEQTLRQFLSDESVTFRLTINHGEREAVLEP